MKKKCSFDEFCVFIQTLGFSGEWDAPGSFHTFRTDSGAVINWWPTSGTINVQGQSPAQQIARSAIATLLSMSTSATSSSKADASEPADQSKIEPANEPDDWSTFHAILRVRKVS